MKNSKCIISELDEQKHSLHICFSVNQKAWPWGDVDKAATMCLPQCGAYKYYNYNDKKTLFSDTCLTSKTKEQV